MGRRLRGRRSLGLRLVGATFAALLFTCPPTPAAAGDVRGTTATATPAAAHGVTANRSSDTLALAGLEDQFAQVAERLAPSVVAISATTRGVDRDELVRSDALTADKLAAAVFSGATRTVGTGFVVDADGYILSNDHVVADAEQIWVTTDDKKVYPALVVGSDPRADLAVLKIPATGLAPVTWAKQPARRGQWAVALGNPFGLSSEGQICMSVGVVSGVGRSLPKLAESEKRLYSNLIQTTAEINPGNSGGPLFNLSGELIGINTAVVMPQKQTNGIGFAIPADDDVRALLEDLKAGREVVHGYLGVMVSVPSATDRKAAGVRGEYGARVDTVEPNSPAAGTGLQVGDVVTAVNGKTVRDGDHFVRLVGRSGVAKATALDVARAGGTVERIDVQLRRRLAAASGVNRDTQRFRWRGLLLGPVPSHWAAVSSAVSVQSVARGVMVLAVDRTSSSVPVGVTQGSVITAIGGKAVNDVKDLLQVLNDVPAEQCKVEVAEQPGTMASTAQ